MKNDWWHLTKRSDMNYTPILIRPSLRITVLSGWLGKEAKM